jgi:cell shape-determining protein MreD
MRWPIFIITAFVFLALDASFLGVLTLPAVGGIAPSMLIVLVVFVALFASRFSALSAAMLLGAMADLTLPARPHGHVEAGMYVIGPHALGFLLAAYLVVQLRTMVFRQRVITLSALSLTGAMTAALVAIAIYIVRSWYGEATVYPTDPSAGHELLRQAGVALYTALLAIPLGWVLLASTPVWGFQSGQPRRSAMWR